MAINCKGRIAWASKNNIIIKCNKILEDFTLGDKIRTIIGNVRKIANCFRDMESAKRKIIKR